MTKRFPTARTKIVAFVWQGIRLTLTHIWTGGSSLGVFFYDVESKKDNEIRGMRPLLNSFGLTNTSNIMLAGSPLYNFSSA